MPGRESSSWPKTYAATEAPKEVLDLAARVMPLLLAGDHAMCALLREQYAKARIQQVELTEAGFFVTFEVSADVARTASPSFQGGDVHIRVEGVEHGAGCVLFVRDGVLSTLEGYTYGEEWPEHPLILELRDATPIAPPGEPARRLIHVGGLVDETGVCLAVYGEDLDPAAVTALVGCSPTSAHRKGDRRGPRSPPQKRGGWFLEVRGKAPEGPDELAQALLGGLPEDESVWIKLGELYEVQLRFGIHVTGWNRGFGLSAATATTIARLHASLVFDIYAYDEGDKVEGRLKP